MSRAHAQTIARGRTRAIDVARVNGAYYASEASIGVSSRVTRLQKARDKRRFGLLAVLAGAVAAVRFLRPFYAWISYDGATCACAPFSSRSPTAIISAGFITVADAAIDDGWLDLYSVDIEDAAERLELAGALLSGKPRAAENVRTFRSTAFSVATMRPPAHRRRRGAGREDAGAFRDPAQGTARLRPGGRCTVISKRAFLRENFRGRRAYIREEGHQRSLQERHNEPLSFRTL